MANATENDATTHPQAGLYPIRHVCAETGINDVTLRAWERRYGLIRPMRTPKGHRLYSEEDIQRIQRIMELLDQGIPVSQVHRVLQREDEDATAEADDTPADDGSSPAPGRRPAVSGPGVAPHTADPIANALCHAVDALDVEQLDRAYTRLVMRHGWEGVHERAFLEVYRQLREESRHTPEGEVRLAVFSAWATAALADQLRTALRACEGPAAPCLVLGGGHQQVGGMLLQVSCARRGLSTLPLFDATSAKALESLVQTRSARGVILHGSSQLLRSPELNQVEAILKSPGVPVYIAGSAAPKLAQVESQRPVEVLPGAPLEAADLLWQRLGRG
ncbi:MerR family transcriptional regulator [Thioalkalivibrio sp. ALJ24]|uniref:MerR family transcriptional regulator n=1 Tax=Thioalkalivibrio sp. ALJ24 TaxID=545276 RepID=UPI00037A631E|nr:MerR family transcriptional regulator [Thioalkalivibrio sp. ALJ24]